VNPDALVVWVGLEESWVYQIPEFLEELPDSVDRLGGVLDIVGDPPRIEIGDYLLVKRIRWSREGRAHFVLEADDIIQVFPGQDRLLAFLQSEPAIGKPRS
jgi:hypothetical protein